MWTALAELDLAPEKVLVVTGIGQAPKLPHYIRVNMLNGLHGREVATAASTPNVRPASSGGSGRGIEKLAVNGQMGPGR